MKSCQIRSRTGLLPLAALIAIACYSKGAVGGVPIYGGPTYSAASGGYSESDVFIGINPPAIPNSLGVPKNRLAFVNDSGIAVGNFLRADGPITATGMGLAMTSVFWSSSLAPTEIVSNSASVQTEAINSAGSIAGVFAPNVRISKSLSAIGVYFGDPSEATRWTDLTSAPQTLPGPGSTSPYRNYALAINNSGTVVGSVAAPEGSHAARWNSAGALTELGTILPNPSMYGTAVAFAVNDAGTAVGWASHSDGFAEPVRWDALGPTATKLDSVIGPIIARFANGSAVAINNSGTIVGGVTKPDAVGLSLGLRAVRWNAGGTALTELGNLGLDSDGKTQTFAFDINDAGVAIGMGYKSGNQTIRRGIRWNPGSTTAIELQPLPSAFSGAPDTFVSAINAQGLAVGQSEGAFPNGLDTHAVYWDANGVPVDLNSLIDPNSGWTLIKAYDISNSNWIVGQGIHDPDGAGSQPAEIQMFLLQVPEPMACVPALSGAVLCLMAGRAAKRDSKSECRRRESPMQPASPIEFGR